MKFNDLVKSIISENIGSSGQFAGDSGAQAIRDHERYKSERISDMNARSGYNRYGNDSFRSRERNAGLEKEDAAEKMFWNIYTVKRDESGKIVDRSAVRGKDGKQFGAFGMTKASLVVKKLQEKPFNAGKEYQLMNNRGETLRDVLRF